MAWSHNPESLAPITPEVDPDARRVAEFVSILGRVTSSSICAPDFDFDNDELPVDAAERRFINNDLIGDLAFYGRTIDDKPTGFEARVARGGKRSNHGVFFGDIYFGDESVPVAVKPHHDNASKTCFGDFFKGCAVQELGTYTLQPFGFIIGEISDTRAYSMTILEDGISTLDSIDWSNYLPDTSKNPGMQELWRSIREQAAVLHAEGRISHGDLAARNIATTTEGSTFFIDWELACLKSAKTADVQARVEQSYIDLQKLLESMASPPGAKNITPGIGILYEKDVDWWESYRDIFFDGYRDARRILAENSADRRTVINDVEIELDVLECNLKRDCQMMQEICKTVQVDA